jgi:hypothetical protein
MVNDRRKYREQWRKGTWQPEQRREFLWDNKAAFFVSKWEQRPSQCLPKVRNEARNC